MTEHLEKILEQTAALRAPLAGDAPAGADVALEPEFEKIKAELDKLTSLEGGEVDWRLVVETAEELLSSRTKDLRLAIWLTAGGAQRSGWGGYVRGLAVCRSLVLDMWDSMFPKRDKARANIVLWLSERLAPVIAELGVTMSDGDDVRAAAELIQEIDRALADKLGDAYPGMRGLVSATKNQIANIPEPPPPPPPPEETAASEWVDDDDDDEPAPESKEEEPASAAPAAAAGGSVALSTTVADAAATTRTCGEALVALARSIASTDPARAWSYRLHRQGIWLPFERIVVDGGVVAMPGPDAATADRLRDLLASCRWSELVVASEEATAACPLWLDPHRFVAVALERMGTAFTEAREVVGRDTTDFARRNAALLGASFSDGQPAAHPETVEWLEAEARRWQLGSRADDRGRDEDRELAARFAEARDLVAAGRHAEGLAIAMQLARRGADPRERFRSSLDVARLAIHAGALDVARPILEGLVATATAHSLETWDPALCARLYAGLYRCLPPDAPDRAKVFEVLCRLDPGAALRVRGNGMNGHAVRPSMGGVSSVPVTTSTSTASSSAAPTTSSSSSASTSSSSEWVDDDDD